MTSKLRSQDPSLKAPSSKKEIWRAKWAGVSTAMSLGLGIMRFNKLRRQRKHAQWQCRAADKQRKTDSTLSIGFTFPPAGKMNINSILWVSCARLAPTQVLNRNARLRDALMKAALSATRSLWRLRPWAHPWHSWSDHRRSLTLL